MSNLTALEAVLCHEGSSRSFLDTLDENKMRDLSGEILAKFYWRRRNPHWYLKDTNQLFAKLRWIHRLIKKRLNTGRVQPELSENGSVMERFNFPVGDVLEFSIHYLRRQSGWEVVYQDDGYNALFVNRETLELCTYCEGDVVMMKAPNRAAFESDRNRLSWWYVDNV